MPPTRDECLSKAALIFLPEFERIEREDLAAARAAAAASDAE